MGKALSSVFFLASCLVGSLGCTTPLWAQTASPTPLPQLTTTQAQPSKTGTDIAASTRSTPDRANQLIENITIEDHNAVIDERRFGGETRSITVAPKGGMPAYDIAPGNGQHSWKIFSF